MLHAILVLMLNKQIPCGNIYVKMLINREKKINKRECMALFPYFFYYFSYSVGTFTYILFFTKPSNRKNGKVKK